MYFYDVNILPGKLVLLLFGGHMVYQFLLSFPKMNQEQLLTFCGHILELKEKIKCMICLDVIKDVAELECGHKFCSECYEEYKSQEKNITCPCCKKAIKRRSSIYKDDYCNKLGIFVSNVCDTLKRTYDLEVEQIYHSQLGKNIVTKKGKKSGTFIKNVETLSTSKNEEKIMPTSEVHPFDELLRKTEPKSKRLDHLLNRRDKRHVYSRKKEKEPDPNYLILDFGDDRNKTAVLQWLNDTRNNFNRLTQTQVDKNQEEIIPVFDLTSVSQVNNVPEQQKRFKHKIRAKSLDIEIKKAQRNKKRLSDGSFVDLIDNDYIKHGDIEEEEIVKKVEENVLMHFIEDQYLDNLENELMNGKKLKPKVSPKEDAHSSGWARVGKIAKTIKKKKKVPKKLDISIQSSQSSNLKKGKENLSNVSNTNDCVLKVEIEKMKLQSKTQGKKIPDPVELEKEREAIVHTKEAKKTYDLENLETYMEKNMLAVEQNNSDDKEMEIDEHKVDEKEGNAKIKILKVVVIKADTKNVSNTDVDDPFLLPTQKWNISSENNSLTEKKNTDVDDDIYPAAIEEFPVPAETLDEFNSERNKEKTEPQTVNNPFLMLTQQNLEKMDCNDETEINSEHLNNVGDTIEALEKNLVECFTKSPNLLAQMKSYLNRLKILTTNVVAECLNKSTQTEYEFSYKETQTCLVHFDKSFQTDLEMSTETKKQVCDMQVQTSDGIEAPAVKPEKITQYTKTALQNCITNPEVTQSTSNIKNIQVDAEISKPSISNTKFDIDKSKNSVGKSQNQLLTCSFDNLKFDTQDLTKIASQKKIHSQNDVLETKANTTSQSSVLVYTLDSNFFRSAKKKLIFDDSKQKGSKRALSDSESEEIILPKRLCNRFIRDDLSIEFNTNVENTETQRSRGASDVDNEVDYEGFLDKFMKRYDSNGIITSPEKIDDILKHEPSKNSNHASDVAMDCDVINAKVNENIENLAKLNNTSKSVYCTASQNLRVSEMSDIICETESYRVEPLMKKAKKVDSKDLISLKRNDEKSRVSCDDIYDLEDSLDDADFVNIKIDIEDEPIKIEKDVEEDLFSDDDIVETTPQKPKNPIGKRSHQSPDHLSENFAFDIDALPPPIAFQDEPAQTENNNSSGEITLVDANISIDKHKQSLTPDGLSQLRSKTDEKDSEPNLSSPHCPKQLPITTKKLRHSTPFTQRSETTDTLGFSPITGGKNLKSQTLTSKETPKTKSTIMTSTPRQKSIWNYVRSQEQPEKEPTKPCIACTRLSKDQILSISTLTNRKLATYSSSFDRKVTHMIVSVDSNNCIKDYTMKFVAAVASGIWVLRFDWVKECLQNNSIVLEEPFEVLDDIGLPGPRTSRLAGKKTPLFEGFKFFCANPFYTAAQHDVEEVIRMQGGKILSSMSKLKEEDGRISLIITEAKNTPDFQMYENWIEMYKTVTVDIEWLSRSVGRHKILNIRRFILVSDDNLDGLGYPEYLVESTESSTEQYTMSEKY